MKENQQIVVTNKNRVEIDSVLAVKTFDEDGIIIESILGLISIEGIGLKIENFEKATTKILVTGNIIGVYYIENKGKKKGRLAIR